MRIVLKINQNIHELEVAPGDILLKVLRSLGYFGVKHGCETGECGVCTILLDGKPVNSCLVLAAQAEGHFIETVESLGQYPQQGWKTESAAGRDLGLHPLQEAFIENGSVQCGYCTPAQILAAKALLDQESEPSEEKIREAISGVLCRCTGYIKPVQAVLRAAARMRGEDPDALREWLPAPEEWLNPPDDRGSFDGIESPPSPGLTMTEPKVVISKTRSVESKDWKIVGQPERKTDASKLVQGKPVFAADIEKRGMLIAKVLRSPYAHARIRQIDVSQAKSLPGVAAVLTWQDIPRVIYSTAGQSDPIPGPLDTFSLDHKVRFVGDRVAFVAAESAEIADQALRLIRVEYEQLPAFFDPGEAMKPGAPRIHDEPEYVNFADSDPSRNLAAKIEIDIGDVERGFAEADHIIEGDYEVSKVQQAHMEPHVVVTYWDEDDRLVIRTSTQVPFHVRRILAPVLKLPVKRIRVIKPRIGGGFGGKQEVLIEDVAAHLTIATGRPVFYEYTREEEFTSSRSRHPMRIHLKTGVKSDGTMTANAMSVLTDTGALGCHALTVTGNTGHKSMALYVGDGQYRQNPNIQFHAHIVYTNHPPAGAYRGYGVPQGFWAVEQHMEKIARELEMDPLEFRLKNSIRAGELHPFSTAWSEGRAPQPETIQTCGLQDCIQQGKNAIEWDRKYNNSDWHIVHDDLGREVPYLRKGVGVALVMQGTAIPYLDMGGASVKMNDDGSFNLLVGATDLGTGSDTVLAQMAAEVLGVAVEDIIIYSSDTDFTPFDKGAYASSTTYISGTAVVKASRDVAALIKKRAAKMIAKEHDLGSLSPDDITLTQGRAISSDGFYVTLEQVALDALHHDHQEQIMAVASYVSPVSPPPFAAQFAEVIVDLKTGQLVVQRLVMAVDSGMIVNPLTASGQIEGGMTQALGYAVCEEMQYDEKGTARETNFQNYHIFRSNEMPELTTIFVETFEPTHPFGVKAVAEIPMDGVAPAVANAVFDACGARICTNPITPEKIWDSLQNRG
jgi:putative selenate reductase molybdopterin-binding subunit